MDATAIAAPRLRLYDSPGTPNHWAVEDEGTGELWLVPGVENGWQRRTLYRGHRQALRPVWGYCWAGLGCPLRRPWPEVARDRGGRN
jgi:hypothetical protein